MSCTSANKTIKELLEDATARERDEKLDRLMKDYGIEAGDYKSLARQLAIDHIPGFRPALKLEYDTWGAVTEDKKGGRPTEWSTKRLDELIIAVTDARKLPGISTDDEALRHIAKSGKWAQPANRDDLGKWIKTLKNVLALARRIQRDVSRLQERLEEIKRDNPEN